MEGFWALDAKPFGPAQLYVAPATVEAVRFSVDPAQMGPLLPAVGAEGVGLTVAVVVPGADGQLATVATTEYVPEAAAVAPTIDGFCALEVNPLGPVQLYVAPATVEAVRFNVEPAQMGPLLPAVGVAGGVQLPHARPLEHVEFVDMGVSAVPGQLFVAVIS